MFDVGLVGLFTSPLFFSILLLLRLIQKYQNMQLHGEMRGARVNDRWQHPASSGALCPRWFFVHGLDLTGESSVLMVRPAELVMMSGMLNRRLFYEGGYCTDQRRTMGFPCFQNSDTLAIQLKKILIHIENNIFKPSNE